MAEFDFKAEVEETKWLIDNLIPIGHLCFVLAQAGVGKSLLVEAIAISIIKGIPFGDKKAVEGDVLIVDQDTPADTLKKRLLKLGNALEMPNKHKLFVESMKGYSLDNGTLQTIISDHPTAVLTIVDSLHSVCGKLNPNYTTDMSVLAKLKSRCINAHNSIIFNHHISQKEELTVDVLMTGDAGHFAMGSSTIMQQADTYYIVGASATDGRTNRIYVRPVSKRTSIPGKPLILRLLATEKGELIEYDGVYESGLGDTEADILTLFKEQDLERTVKEVYEAMGHRYGEQAIRASLSELDKRGFLAMSKHKSNLFKFRLP
jgi:RecA-family ATPase